MAEIVSRYGRSIDVSNPSSKWITQRLLAELRTEKLDEPDNEHTQVSVGNEHWAVSAQISGLITFDNIDLLEGVESDLPESMYLRNIPDETLIAIWQAIVTENRESLLAHPWRPLEELPPFSGDFYRQGV